MQHMRNIFRANRNSRHGLSFVEFVGFFAALAGGVVLGSMYLGVDLKTMARTALERSELIGPSFFGLSNEANAPANDSVELIEGPLVKDSSTIAEDAGNKAFVPTERNEGAGREETLNDETTLSPGKVANEKMVSKLPELTEEQQEAATRSYWLALSHCMEQEASDRSATITDSRNWHLFEYLDHRKQGHQRAAQALEQLAEHGVDPRLVSYAQRVYKWHADGITLFGRAANLLTDAPTSELTGPYAQSWQSAATQHRMEEKLLLDRRGAVASYLAHTYKSLTLSKPAVP